MRSLIVFTAVLALVLMGSTAMADFVDGGTYVTETTGKNVGIGTAAPPTILSIGNLTKTGEIVLTIQGASSSGQSITFDDGTGVEGRIRYSHGGRSMTFRVADADRMTINSNGKVGIGTTNPAQPLHVAGNAEVNGWLYVKTSDGGTLDLSNSATGNRWILQDRGNYTDHLWIQHYDDEDKTWLNVMSMSPTGNVGIGTISATANYKLDVVGVILANDVDILGEAVSLKTLISKVAVLEATPPEYDLEQRVIAIETALNKAGASGISKRNFLNQ